MQWHRQFWEEPQTKAEFEYWTKMPTWSLEEIVALSLGKCPYFVSSDKFVHGTRGTDFSTAYFSRLEIVQRHYADGELSERTRPTRVVEWALEYDFPMPKELVERVQQMELRRMEKRNTQFGTIGAETIQHIASVQNPVVDGVTEESNATSKPSDTPDLPIEGPDLPSTSKESEAVDPNEQPLHPKHRKTLLTLIGVMVLKSYRYKIGSDLGALTHTLESQLIDLGIQMHKDTIRNYVRSALAMVEENQAKRK